MRKIEVNTETFQFLQKAFGISRVTLWRALSYKSNTDRAKKIRSLAMQKGGQVWTVDDKQMDTVYDHDGVMHQYFGEHISLVVDRSNHVTVYIDGEVKEEHDSMTISQLMKLQERMRVHAASLS